jgi:hypothetical protein
MPEVIQSAGKFLLVTAAPIAFHYFALFGKILPAKITTRAQWFDRFYNNLPWLPSIAVGTLSASAWELWKSHVRLAFPLLVLAAVFLFVDLVGGSMSMYAYMRRKQR